MSEEFAVCPEKGRVVLISTLGENLSRLVSAEYQILRLDHALSSDVFANGGANGGFEEATKLCPAEIKLLTQSFYCQFLLQVLVDIMYQFLLQCKCLLLRIFKIFIYHADFLQDNNQILRNKNRN